MCIRDRDNIYMNYYSTLGPIDPQVPNKEGHLVAALGYLDKINELLEKARHVPPMEIAAPSNGLKKIS